MREQLLHVFGELDLAEAPAFRDELLATIAHNPVDLVLDFTDVTFLDCAGIRVLVEAESILREQGRHLRVLHVARGPRVPLEVLDLVAILHVEEPRRS